ncbi:origin recognition complex, subunit 6 [Echria macrotheca]|uniref:Origin recognition complex, subunit 6 n=1 Tax=Echria macrotheca TaxID=438768 RepID=A0AAJ0BSN0_9PEZI|nr:origin recognition complex, subunit 6 [Echria macrotheca]
MNRSLEQALLSLLPTHNSTLPQPLTELASSLLAQSRHRASTLKAEEEIARLYACANIACDRLKISLNLPPIEPRPPIPPRIYKRLYNHLDHILPAPTSSTPKTTRTRIPSAKLRDGGVLGTSPLSAKSRPTPGTAQQKSLAQFRADATPSKTGRTSRTPAKKAASLPPWIRPTMRFLCAADLGSPRLGPVVMAGVESVIAPRGKRTDDEWVNANMAAVVGVLYLYVWNAVVSHGREADPAELGRMRRLVAEALQRAREEVEIEDDEGWEGWRDVRIKDLDAAAIRSQRHGWLEMDWAAGVGDLMKMERRDGEEGEAEGGDDEGGGGLGHIRRADTMLQERFDYLSERRRGEYDVWKEGILERIRELEQAPSKSGDTGAMDIDG